MRPKLPSQLCREFTEPPLKHLKGAPIPPRAQLVLSNGFRHVLTDTSLLFSLRSPTGATSTAATLVGATIVAPSGPGTVYAHAMSGGKVSSEAHKISISNTEIYVAKIYDVHMIQNSRRVPPFSALRGGAGVATGQVVFGASSTNGRHYPAVYSAPGATYVPDRPVLVCYFSAGCGVFDVFRGGDATHKPRGACADLRHRGIDGWKLLEQSAAHLLQPRSGSSW